MAKSASYMARNRAGGSGNNSNARKAPVVKEIDGVKYGGVFTTWIDVDDSSPNKIWVENTSKPHALLHNDRGGVHLIGDKNEKFGLLDHVNTAVVHLRGMNPDNYTTRQVNRLNKDLKYLRNIGFYTEKINVASDETVIYVKRERFTREF